MPEEVKMYVAGIDIGYSSTKVSLINRSGEIECSSYSMHRGQIKPSIKEALRELLAKYSLSEISLGAVTGSGSDLLVKPGAVESVNEVQSLVEGAMQVNNTAHSIIEIGGQSAKYITGFSKQDKSHIKMSMNANCSAGTGSFLEEQMSRLNMEIGNYSTCASKAKSIPRIAGRCSVFAKTDIIHHQQEGTPVEDILMGLAYALVKSYRGSVIRKLSMVKPVLFIGGVAHNEAIVTALRDILCLNNKELIIPEYCGNVASVGAAVIALQNNIRIDIPLLLAGLDEVSEFHDVSQDTGALPALAAFGDGDSRNKHVCKEIVPGQRGLACYLGVDVGSTSTNLVLADEKEEIVSYKYLRTRGNPAQAVINGLKELEEELDDKVNILAAGVTGSGRYMIGALIGADSIKDEITAQARAAVAVDSSIDTIFEIGGQDSKFISLASGIVTDFQMNKVCAAGTGSFIEEQSHKFNIPIDNFGELALSSSNPINLGERCTVFIETSIAANLSSGAELKDIASGLCYSVARNYLNRVVGQKKIGNKISCQGGIAYNQGIVNAFRSLTGKPVSVLPFFSVSGAYGAAILAKEEIGDKNTLFKGFHIESPQKQVDKRLEKPKSGNTAKFNKSIEELVFEGYDRVIDIRRATVGIPRALFAYGMFPMFNTFFKELGFNVLLSDPTSEETIRLGQEYSLDETCYPVKLINGHVAELVQKKVDYIFFPDLYTVDHPGSHTRQNYGCVYMQLAFKMINQAMELKIKGIELLAPTIAFNLGKEFMLKSFLDLGRQMGKDPQLTTRALQKSMQAILAFENRMEENGKIVMASIKPSEKAFVLISKIYGIADPVLNMGIPGRLMDMGYKVLSFFDLPEGDISQEHPNMYWPFGQHILEPVKLIKQHPDLYAILLTHHGCGPDSVMLHYFKELMGDKPYLNIEVDEHSSDVGVITRIEAFVNSLRKLPAKKAGGTEIYAGNKCSEKVQIRNRLAGLKDGATLYLPQMYPYSHIFEKILIGKGINARVLPQTDIVSIDIGKKYTLTNEYLSLTALLGDALKELGKADRDEVSTAFLIPQTEGAEVYGQYNRFLRAKLDEAGYRDTDIIAPFVEDAVYQNGEDLRSIYLGLLAGDIVRIAPAGHRDGCLKRITESITRKQFEIDTLVEMARELKTVIKSAGCEGKRIFAIGEPFILFNDFLNGFILKDIEANGHRVIYCPFSEYMWLMWQDYVEQNGKDKSTDLRRSLNEFERYISAVSGCFSEETPFEKDLKEFAAAADDKIKYYAGWSGRYREAKLLSDLPNIQGSITVASTYENTGIALGILHRGFENGMPVLNLTFDGNKNRNDQSKIEAFIHYL